MQTEISLVLAFASLPPNAQALLRLVGARKGAFVNVALNRGDATLCTSYRTEHDAVTGPVMLRDSGWIGSDNESNSQTTIICPGGMVASKDAKMGRIPARYDLSVSVAPKLFDDMARMEIVTSRYGRFKKGEERTATEFLAVVCDMIAELGGTPVFTAHAEEIEVPAPIARALVTLPPTMTPKDIVVTPPAEAVWNTGKLPAIGDVLKAKPHYPSNERGAGVPPGTPGKVIGYYAEHGYLYCVTQFPGKAVLVAAVDVAEVTSSEPPVPAPACTPEAETDALRAAGVL